MQGRIALAAACFLLAACQQAGTNLNENRVKVLIGGTTIPSAGADPLEDSIVVIAGNRIRAVGLRKDVPVPQNSDRTDLTSRWVVPLPGSRIAVDEVANVQILEHAPKGVQPANPADVGAKIVNGEWEKAR